MKRNHLKGLDKKRLRWWLLLFFLSLAIPTAVLIQQSYSRLKWETFHQHQLMAGELTKRINNHLIRLIHTEEQRPFTDYAFLNVAGAPADNFLQRSPLSRYPVQAEIPGLIGYFQVDAAGRLLTPFLPEEIEKAGSYGIAEQELSERAALQNRIRLILNENRLVRNQNAVQKRNKHNVRDHLAQRQDKGKLENEKESASFERSAEDSEFQTPAAPSASAGQAVFDELNKVSPGKSKPENKLGRLEDIKLRQTFQKEVDQLKQEESYPKPLKAAPKKARTEQNVLPESIRGAKKSTGYEWEESNRPMTSAVQPEVHALRIRTFESAVDPFEFS
jgi:hypothetical protein